MEKKYVVYQHVTPDGMYYFGQTQNVEKRWRNNGAGYKGTGLYPYIEKYGWDNIQHIVLFREQTIENALWIENFLIETAREDGVCINKQRSGLVSKEEGYNQDYYEQNKQRMREQHKEYYEENKQQIREYQKQYREENKQQIREQQKEYYEQNKQRMREQHKEYYEENKQQILEQKKQYYEQNKDKKQQYREENKDKIREYQREYHQKNREKRLEQRRQRYQRKKEEKQLQPDGCLPLW